MCTDRKSRTNAKQLPHLTIVTVGWDGRSTVTHLSTASEAREVVADLLIFNLNLCRTPGVDIPPWLFLRHAKYEAGKELFFCHLFFTTCT